jgi:hypothetical protein
MHLCRLRRFRPRPVFAISCRDESPTATLAVLLCRYRPQWGDA